MAKLKGSVLMSRYDRLLLLCDNNKYYIVKGKGSQGQYVEFEEENSLPMPSYMFAVAAMEEENLGETLNFIQNKWFEKNK